MRDLITLRDYAETVTGQMSFLMLLKWICNKIFLWIQGIHTSPWKTFYPLYSFPVAAIRNNQKPRGLKQHIVSPSQLWNPGDLNQGVSSPAFSLRALGENWFPLASSFCWLTSIPALMVPSLNSCHTAFCSFLYLPLSHNDTCDDIYGPPK